MTLSEEVMFYGQASEAARRMFWTHLRFHAARSFDSKLVDKVRCWLSTPAEQHGWRMYSGILCSWLSVRPSYRAFDKLPCILAYLCMYPRASAMFEQAMTFLSFNLSSRTGHRERAVLEKLVRSPLASMPQQATASATHTMLLSLVMIFFSSLQTYAR